MRKRSVVGILLLALLLLAACSSGGETATAVQYIEALDAGHVETADDLVCDQRADDIRASMMSVTTAEATTTSFENVSCSARGSDVACRYTVTQESNAAAPQQFDRQVVFELEDDLICGFEEEVAN